MFRAIAVVLVLLAASSPAMAARYHHHHNHIIQGYPFVSPLYAPQVIVIQPYSMPRPYARYYGTFPVSSPYWWGW